MSYNRDWTTKNMIIEKMPCEFCGKPIGKNWGFIDMDEEWYVCRRCNKLVHKMYDIAQFEITH